MSKIIKIAVDAGHGINTAGKRTPDGEREWLFNNKVAKALIDKLGSYKNIQILRLDDPTGKTDVPLKLRTDRANYWGADILISIHHNAMKGIWANHGGVETFVHPTGSRESYDLAYIIQPRIVKAMGLRDRKVQQKNLHMLRESNMPAILTEGGFMDSTTDIKALRNDVKLKEQGIAIAEGLAAHFKLQQKDKEEVIPSPQNNTTKGMGLVKINTDGLSLRKGPSLSAELERKLSKGEQYYAYAQEGMWYNLGADLWVSEGSAKNHVTFTPHPKELYRVRKSWIDAKSQIGAFHNFESAKELADKNKEYKVYNEAGKELYKYTEKIEQKPDPVIPKPEEPKEIIKNPIKGKSIATVEQMVAFVEKENKDAKNLRDIALSFLEVGEKYGIRGDVAYCQSILETHWFKFDLGTAVTPDQHNYCGMGVTKKGMKGNSFKTVKDGVTAQIQHLLVYATNEDIPEGEILLDPRWDLVIKAGKRGIAPNWEDLSMKWAMNENYGTHILSFYDKLIATPIPEVLPEPEEEINLEDILQWIKDNKDVQETIIELFKLWNEKGEN